MPGHTRQQNCQRSCSGPTITTVRNAVPVDEILSARILLLRLRIAEPAGIPDSNQGDRRRAKVFSCDDPRFTMRFGCSDSFERSRHRRLALAAFVGRFRLTDSDVVLSTLATPRCSNAERMKGAFSNQAQLRSSPEWECLPNITTNATLHSHLT